MDFFVFFYLNIRRGVRASNIRELMAQISLGEEKKGNLWDKDYVVYIKQLLDEVEHDIMNYQNRGLCYLPQPSASADNTDTRF